jgi:hypothetical protein
MQKICIKCQIPKDPSEYHKKSANKDGRQGTCKKCASKNNKQWREEKKEHLINYRKQWREENPNYFKEYVKQHYAENPNYFKEYVKQHYVENKDFILKRNKEYYENNKNKISIKSKEWKKNNPEKVLKQQLRYHKKNPKHNKARVLVNQAIKAGVLIKQPCEVCNKKLVEAHHEDYNKPLDIIWLCKEHHLEVHGGRWDTI